MRMKLKFDLKEIQLPMDYRPLFISYFKRALTDYKNGELFETYYAPSIHKPFSFAVLFYGAEFSKEIIKVNQKRIDLIWSTADQETGINFYNAFNKRVHKEFALPDGNSMSLQNIYLEQEEEIVSDTIDIQFLSPLCVRHHEKVNNKDIYFSFEREGFYEILLETIKTQIKGIFSERIIDNFKLSPIEAKKTVIKHQGGQIEASIGSFRLEGDPKLFNFLYQAGMCSRRSAGFGLFTILMQRR